MEDFNGDVHDLSGDVGDLDRRVVDLSGDVRDLIGSVVDLCGDIADLIGSVADLSGCVRDLIGSVIDLIEGVTDRSRRVRDLIAPVGDLSGRPSHPTRSPKTDRPPGGGLSDAWRPYQARSVRLDQAGWATLRRVLAKRPASSRRNSSRPCAPPDSLIWL